MPETRYSLVELARQVGIPARTIRSYIEQGLLRGPETPGRNAYYSCYHLARLRAIQVLKDLHGHSLDEIRRLLLSMSEEEIRRVAEPAAQAKQALLTPRSSSAWAYLQTLQRRDGEPPYYSAPATASPLPPTPVELLVRQLEQMSGATTVPRKTKGEPWFCLAITPDIELRIRGAQSPDQLARWERIADHLRHMLLGGKES